MELCSVLCSHLAVEKLKKIHPMRRAIDGLVNNHFIFHRVPFANEIRASENGSADLNVEPLRLSGGESARYSETRTK